MTSHAADARPSGAVQPAAQWATGQWFTDETRWWFDSGSIALDFAYTGALGGRPERMHTADDIASWLSERFTAVTASGREVQPADALMLRAAIAHLADAAASDAAYDARDIDVVNLFAATPDLPPALAGGTRQAGATRASARQALSTIARETIAIVTEAASGRIRRCSAEDCDILYLDTSRSGTRRWCSMQRCGNRAKVRAHRARAAALSR